MQFSLIDRIESLEPGQSVVATKSLSMAEEYLRDHFPNFPVMPGVLMLEALTQASAWLIRVSEDFANSMVLLKEAKNVKYGKFVQPGQTIRIVSTITNQFVSEQGEKLTVLKAEGTMDGQTNLRAHLTLCRYNLADRDPSKLNVDKKVIAALKEELDLLL
ncbi:MAG: 3-hydroxyacyl-ACP dehydratase FabZ family protein [Thermoguttaceae bacterium]